MRKALNIAALLFVLTALAFGLVGCDGNADQAKADEMLGTDVKLNGTWKSQTVTYTHDGKQYSGQVELKFNDDQLQIVAPHGTSKIHRYTRNGIALNITDPYISEDNPYRTFPFALEFDSAGFAVDLGALTFMEGADNIKLKFTKTSDLAGDFSEDVPSTGDIRTKSDLLASISGVLTPPSSGFKDPDESTVSLVNSVLDRLNRDYDGKTHDNDSDDVYMGLGIFEGDSANGYLFCVIKYSSEDGDEETYNGKITSNGNVIVFDDAKYKKNVSIGNYSEGGSVTVNGKSVGFEYAMNLIPEDDNSVKEYWELCVDPYRSGTYSVFSGSERQNNILACSDSIVVLDIATNGHMVQIKYTCPSDVSSFRYGPDCKLDYVAVDGSFYNTAKFQKVFDKLPADIKLSSTLMEFDTFAEIQGRNLQLTAEITLRDGGTSKDVVWETPEDTSVFKVQSMADGILTFQICKPGTYVISAHADYEGQHFKTAQCVITTNDALTQLRIYDATNDNTFTDNDGVIGLSEGDIIELSPIYTPTSTSQRDVLWSVDNTSVATISVNPNHTAVLTAVGPGEVTVTLMSQENTSIKRILTVLVAGESDVFFVEGTTLKGLTDYGKTLDTIKIPYGVTDIGEGAFEDCSGLTSINIPDSVTSISNGAFSGCSSLTDIYVNQSESETLFANASVPEGCTIHWNSTGPSDIETESAVTLHANFMVDGLKNGLDDVRLITISQKQLSDIELEEIQYPNVKWTSKYEGTGINFQGVMKKTKAGTYINTFLFQIKDDNDKWTTLGGKAFCTELVNGDNYIEDNAIVNEYNIDRLLVSAPKSVYGKINGRNYIVINGINPITFTYQRTVDEEVITNCYWYLNGYDVTTLADGPSYSFKIPTDANEEPVYGIYRVSCCPIGDLDSTGTVTLDVIVSPNAKLEEFDWGSVLDY